MTNRAISLFNQLRPVSVGFDNVFDHFERMFEDDFITNMPSFPHYNIVKTGENKYDIEIALAGYNKKDIEVELKEGILSIKPNCKLLLKEQIVAKPGFSRWWVPVASVSIHLCIGSVYAWSIFNPALIKELGVVGSSADDLRHQCSF